MVNSISTPNSVQANVRQELMGEMKVKKPLY